MVSDGESMEGVEDAESRDNERYGARDMEDAVSKDNNAESNDDEPEDVEDAETNNYENPFDAEEPNEPEESDEPVIEEKRDGDTTGESSSDEEDSSQSASTPWDPDHNNPGDYLPPGQIRIPRVRREINVGKNLTGDGGGGMFSTDEPEYRQPPHQNPQKRLQIKGHKNQTNILPENHRTSLAGNQSISPADSALLNDAFNASYNENDNQPAIQPSLSFHSETQSPPLQRETLKERNNLTANHTKPLQLESLANISSYKEPQQPHNSTFTLSTREKQLPKATNFEHKEPHHSVYKTFFENVDHLLSESKNSSDLLEPSNSFISSSEEPKTKEILDYKKNHSSIARQNKTSKNNHYNNSNSSNNSNNNSSKNSNISNNSSNNSRNSNSSSRGLDDELLSLVKKAKNLEESSPVDNSASYRKEINGGVTNSISKNHLLGTNLSRGLGSNHTSSVVEFVVSDGGINFYLTTNVE